MMKPSKNPPPIIAVDAPSGWHVENGDESGQFALPAINPIFGHPQCLVGEC